MNRERFEELVARAVETLPEQFLERMENVVVVVEDRPTRAQLAKAGAGRSYTLFGLYEGVPLTKRGRRYNLVTPDRIAIFQKPIEFKCRDDAEITAEVQKVVRHEIAHHFGIDESTMRQIEREKYRRQRGL